MRPRLPPQTGEGWGGVSSLHQIMQTMPILLHPHLAAKYSQWRGRAGHMKVFYDVTQPALQGTGHHRPPSAMTVTTCASHADQVDATPRRSVVTSRCDNACERCVGWCVKKRLGCPIGRHGRAGHICVTKFRPRPAATSRLYDEGETSPQNHPFTLSPHPLVTPSPSPAPPTRWTRGRRGIRRSSHP
jgi:hypothetical protein